MTLTNAYLHLCRRAMKAATDLYDVSVLDIALLQRKLFDKVSRGPGSSTGVWLDSKSVIP